MADSSVDQTKLWHCQFSPRYGRLLLRDVFTCRIRLVDSAPASLRIAAGGCFKQILDSLALCWNEGLWGYPMGNRFLIASHSVIRARLGA